MEEMLVVYIDVPCPVGLWAFSASACLASLIKCHHIIIFFEDVESM